MLQHSRKETLAAALVRLASEAKAMRRDKDVSRILSVRPYAVDLKSILIEAAMMARNAPGLNRKFAVASWDFIPEELWNEERARLHITLLITIRSNTAF